MLLRSGIEVTTERDVVAILIPDGTEFLLPQGAPVFIQQVLGGMFTVQTEDGLLVRIDGKDASAIGQAIPEERRPITEDEVNEKGIDACVLEQLKTCYDPEIPVNIVDLGLIYHRDIEKSSTNSAHYLIRIEMTLTAPGCGMGEILKSDVEKKLRDIPTVANVLIDLVFDPPWESSRMSEAAKLKLGFF
jgi:probable FeS assembly SUF system protein SufT